MSSSVKSTANESEQSAISIEVCGVSKVYPIYDKPNDRLKQMIMRSRRKYYREFVALQNINLTVERGETLAVIGRNGSGKSTLLQIICGTLHPTAGEVKVRGRVAALLELGAGFNPEFTGKENVFLSASVLGLREEQIAERYDAIIEFAGIGDFINQPVKLYSSGMFARLAFAVAAHVDADVLIVDEILAVGDAAFAQRCMRFINDYKRRGTLLFVSHDTASVVNLCERAVWLESGTIREIGVAKDVCHNYLAAISSEKDTGSSFKIGGSRKEAPKPTSVKDVRHELLSSSQGANRIEIFDFDPDAPWFGVRGATVQRVEILAPSGAPLVVLSGGEEVVLAIDCAAHKKLVNPIIGFFIKDRLGQHLFGDSTHLSFADEGLVVEEGKAFRATFHFQLPYLPSGDYSVLVAVAEGNQLDHVHHQWIDDALFFRVHASHVTRGLVGIPMIGIDMHLVPGTAGQGSADDVVNS